MKITRDLDLPPGASRPEDVKILEDCLWINIHEYDRELYQRMDKVKVLKIKKILKVEITMGPSGGFKGIVIKLEDKKEYSISKSHKVLAREICELLKKNNVSISVINIKRK